MFCEHIHVHVSVYAPTLVKYAVKSQIESDVVGLPSVRSKFMGQRSGRNFAVFVHTYNVM